MQINRLLVPLFLFFSISSASLQAGDNGKRWWFAQADFISLQEAVTRAKQQFNGRIISAETDAQGRHRIKVLTPQGRVRRFNIDAHTGAQRHSKRRW